MSDISCRREGKAGRITLNRPDALNALTPVMIAETERALDAWAADPAVHLVVIDAEGERAFCSGGDIQEMYVSASAGDYEFGRRFWRDEYRLNAKISRYAKPYVAFMHGYTMGGGVGVSCHGSHRVVCENTQVAMPECGIGLVPDVGGSLLLSRAPGRMGEYLGTTAARMGPADAIHAGFADHFIPREAWSGAIAALVESGDRDVPERFAEPPPAGGLAGLQGRVDRHFGARTVAGILDSLESDPHEFARETRKRLDRNSPLSVACAIRIIRRVRESDTIELALEEEFRFTYRSAEHGDFLEGIRASIIDRDRKPVWKHRDLRSVPEGVVSRMLRPLGSRGLQLQEEARGT